MRPSLRFLALALVGWASVRAATIGVLPGAELFKIAPGEAKPPPVVATQFPPIEPVPPPMANPYAQYAPAYAQPPFRPVLIPVYYAAPASVPPRVSSFVTQPRPLYYPSPVDDWPLTRLAAVSIPPRATVVVPAQSTPAAPLAPVQPRFDRLQLTTWALLRGQQTGIAGSQSLASAGQLGASQAGARLTYNINRLLALTARTSSEVGRRGGEIAAGVRLRPLVTIPVWLTAERRQRIGQYGGGRSAFALFLEGGIYQQPLPGQFSLDSYLEGGVVGANHRDLFIDGGLTATRPVFRQFSAGFGLWGGAQPGLYRVDAGPRLTVNVRNNLKVHVDWRQRLTGNAKPGSGPALTLAGDF